MSKPYLHCLAFSFFFVAMAFAQQSAPPALSSPPETAPAPAAASSEGRMKLDVVVADKSGKPVSGLDLKDFTLLDNGLPSKIRSFNAVEGSAEKAVPPVEVILLIDGVNLRYQQVTFVRQEVEKFLRQNSGQLAHPMSVFVFTVRGLEGQSRPSVDGNALAAEVSQLDQSAASLAASNPFLFSVQTLTTIAQNEFKKPGRKLLIWIGPGWLAPDSRGLPTTPKQQQQHFDAIVLLSTWLREARITLYSVSQGTGLSSINYERFLKGVRTAEEANSADLALKVLAVQSGGRVLSPDNDLAAQIASCVQDASAFYTLSFDPPRADHANEYHDLKVQIDKPGLTARTNTGYYNQPEAEPGTANDHASPVPEANHVAASAAKPVTVEQLEQTLKGVQGRTDAEAAKQLSGLVLTERLSSAKLSTWKAGLSGAKARQALVALADASAFLDPPAAEIPADAPPDLAAQRRIMAQAIDYLGKTLPKLPDFFATRVTTHYEGSPQKSGQAGMGTPGGPLHLANSFSATVLYRDGHEVVDPGKAKGKKPNPQAQRLVTQGTFGPILSLAIEDAANGQLKWSRWEQGANGPEAVFHFAVPREKSNYVVNLDDSLFRTEIFELQHSTAYHGEIAVDPATGTILRLVMEADLEPRSPLVRADVMVEYGSVEIGGRTYFCPVRSVSISRGPSSQHLGLDGKQILGPAVTMLNDVAFGDYHVFRSEVQILTGNNPAPEGK
jgi:VWFA-related protein